MNQKQTKAAVEAMLFAAGDPVSADKLAAAVQLPQTAVETALEDLRARYAAGLENMEGFAVAYACARMDIPCVGIRSVSNKVGPRAQDEKDFPGALAALTRVLPALNLI